MARKVCVVCGKQHGILPSSALGRWHQCSNCGRIYCDKHGSELKRAGMLSRERTATPGAGPVKHSHATAVVLYAAFVLATTAYGAWGDLADPFAEHPLAIITILLILFLGVAKFPSSDRHRPDWRRERDRCLAALARERARELMREGRLRDEHVER